MAHARIEDYALLGDTQAAALVSRHGSIDWLCLPRFDSAACFAALLGTSDHGRWSVCPREKVLSTRRRYRPDTLVLETDLETETGTVRLVDCMPPRHQSPDLVRRVEGVSGEVRLRSELVLRFDYGSVVPWVRQEAGRLHAIAGPDSVWLDADVPTHGEGFKTVAEFSVRAGQARSFRMTWHPSHEPAPERRDVEREIESAERWWRGWMGGCTFGGPYREMVRRSLITLKALTYAPTGGIIAAPTTSLPERIGGVRNWDYRYCWLRDATFTLYALLSNGFKEEAAAWRDWLLRAIAGVAADLQIMYGAAGERRLGEQELPWLPGYENSAPVRTGNAAVEQLQLDVFGEVMDVLHIARRERIGHEDQTWAVQRALVRYLERVWHAPDEGIWEVRGPRRQFTHSKLMVWVAFDRAVKAVERSGLEGPVERWRKLRAQVHQEVCERGYDRERNCFTQHYGSSALDASLLLMPLVGFLPASDPRMQGTVAAIERELVQDGLVKRYATHEVEDGLPPGEGQFLACSFWLADNYVLAGRREEGRELFERLLSLSNDVGLLAEEYDPRQGRQLGNFPQALSHVALVNTAQNLSLEGGPATDRPR